MTNRIRKIRKSNGLTQKNVAEALKVTQGAVSQWENGLTWPSIDDLCRLADLFGVTTDALLGRSPIPMRGDMSVGEGDGAGTEPGR